MNMNMYLGVQAGTSMTEVVRYFREKLSEAFISVDWHQSIAILSFR